MSDINTLKELAEKAPQGERKLSVFSMSNGFPEDWMIAVDGNGYTTCSHEDEAKFLAACDPQTILSLITRLEQAEAVVGKLTEALTPSAETKAAYHGEFAFAVAKDCPRGEVMHGPVLVPWTTIKEIMEAIRNRAALAAGEGK